MRVCHVFFIKYIIKIINGIKGDRTIGTEHVEATPPQLKRLLWLLSSSVSCQPTAVVTHSIRRYYIYMWWIKCLLHYCSDCLEQSPSWCPLLYYSH